MFMYMFMIGLHWKLPSRQWSAEAQQHAPGIAGMHGTIFK